MSVYRFKVYFEDDESVWREIEIKSTQTFEEFHFTIQKAINFDDAHSASFYVSNDTWRKGKEIRILRSRKALQAGTWMHEAKIAKFVEDPHQKFVYEFDPDGTGWILLVELSKILPDSPVDYPRISKSVGTSPAQYKATTPIDVVEDDEEEAHIEEDDNYVHKVTEQYHEDEEDGENGPAPMRTKTEAEMSGDEEVIGATAEEEEGVEGFEEESSFEEEEEI
jgi:hypothetical protein